jgi:hypothetical protein
MSYQSRVTNLFAKGKKSNFNQTMFRLPSNSIEPEMVNIRSLFSLQAMKNIKIRIAKAYLAYNQTII